MCAGLHNLDAKLGHAWLFVVGLGRKYDPSHGICSGQQCLRTKAGLRGSHRQCMSLQIRLQPENRNQQPPVEKVASVVHKRWQKWAGDKTELDGRPCGTGLMTPDAPWRALSRVSSYGDGCGFHSSSGLTMWSWNVVPVSPGFLLQTRNLFNMRDLFDVALFPFK